MISDLYQGIPNGPFTLSELVLGLLITVVLRFFIVSAARRSIRRWVLPSRMISDKISINLFWHKGPLFFRFQRWRYHDQSYPRYFLGTASRFFGFIALVIMVYAPLFGVGAMLMKSVSLTLLVVPLLPVIFVYTLKMAKEMGDSSREVQKS